MFVSWYHSQSQRSTILMSPKGLFPKNHAYKIWKLYQEYDKCCGGQGVKCGTEQKTFMANQFVDRSHTLGIISAFQQAGNIALFSSFFFMNFSHFYQTCSSFTGFCQVVRYLSTSMPSLQHSVNLFWYLHNFFFLCSTLLFHIPRTICPCNSA